MPGGGNASRLKASASASPRTPSLNQCSEPRLSVSDPVPEAFSEDWEKYLEGGDFPEAVPLLNEILEGIKETKKSMPALRSKTSQPFPHLDSALTALTKVCKLMYVVQREVHHHKSTVMNRLLTEVKTLNTTLQSKENNTELHIHSKPSYASVAANLPSHNTIPETVSVLVTSTSQPKLEPKGLSRTIRQKTEQSVIEKAIEIIGVTTTANGVIYRFRHPSMRQKFLGLLTETNIPLETKILEKDLPMVMVYDLENGAPENIIESIVKQNQSIFHDIKGSEESQLKVSFTKRGNNEKVHVAIRVPAKYFHRLMAAKKINIGFTRHSVREHINLKQCFNCQGYGHSSKVCTSKEPVCGFCSQSGHKFSDCRSRNDVQKAKCSNCIKYNQGKGRERPRNTNHPCHSSTCDTLKEWAKIIKTRIAYNTHEYSP